MRESGSVDVLMNCQFTVLGCPPIRIPVTSKPPEGTLIDWFPKVGILAFLLSSRAAASHFTTVLRPATP